MYKEYLLNDITNDEVSPEDKQHMIAEFYKSNLSLIGKMAHDQSISIHDYNEYMQLSYSALLDTIKVYNPDSNFSFLSYFRRTFKHKIYLFNLEFQYPVRIKSSTYVKDFHLSFTSYGVTPDQLTLTDRFAALDAHYLQVENQIMSDTIRSILYSELTLFQYTVFSSIFWGNMTKNDVAAKYNKSYSYVRHVYTSGIRKLRRNNALRNLAKDMFGIRI